MIVGSVQCHNEEKTSEIRRADRRYFLEKRCWLRTWFNQDKMSWKSQQIQFLLAHAKAIIELLKFFNFIQYN